MAAFLVAVLLAAACGVFLWEPWHGSVVLSLSQSHGIAAGDLAALPLIALAVAIARGHVRQALAKLRWLAGPRARNASAVALGAVLLLAGVDEAADLPLVPAGGGTFNGGTEHADGRRADPVDRWSHLALTYDGARLRLYVDGMEVSSRTATGTIRKTTDPLWIGGNHPYGEYFRGVIDEVRVYDRALRPAEVRAGMSTPLPSHRIARTSGLVGAYAFDGGSGTVAVDASGHGNAGRIRGATRTSRGRFGSALHFDGAGQMVRVSASASLNVADAMTLSAWIRPTASQSGWRTIVHRQTDAYFLAAGGGTYPEAHVATLDDLRLALLVIAAVWFCAVLAAGGPPSVAGRRRRYWPPVVLLLAGSAVDAALAPSATLIGPALLAVWCAMSATQHDEAAAMYLIAAAFTGMTIVSVVGGGGGLGHEDGGIARSVALGLLLVTAGLLSTLRGVPRREPSA